jgi:phosphoenolpyruvate carboxylase
VLDVLGTFELAAELEQGSLGAYVISQCQQASDVLAVCLLQQDAGVVPKLRVVPLFETLDDLERSAETFAALCAARAVPGRFKRPWRSAALPYANRFWTGLLYGRAGRLTVLFGGFRPGQMPEYLALIGGRQEIMVGYSDSAKDAGRLAATWAQYEAQEKMAGIAEANGVELTFFHGKGGTVGRGGNPALYRAIIGHPPGTINGRFRVTEQGEMITQNFGEVKMAERTLDIFTAGVLAERFEPRPHPKREWRDAMARISEV